MRCGKTPISRRTKTLCLSAAPPNEQKESFVFGFGRKRSGVREK
jgi:hypothetical protein